MQLVQSLVGGNCPLLLSHHGCPFSGNQKQLTQCGLSGTNTWRSEDLDAMFSILVRDGWILHVFLHVVWQGSHRAQRTC